MFRGKGLFALIGQFVKRAAAVGQSFCDNLFDSRTITNYAQVQVDYFNPNIDQSLPSSVQQNNFTWRPRTIGITATFRL